MLKYFFVLAMAMTSLAHADSFYVGGSVGASSLKAKKDHEILSAAPAVLKSENHDLGNFGFVGGGFVGYNFDLNNCWDCGVEGFGYGYTTEAEATHNLSTSVTIPSKLKISQHYSCGVRLLPGYRFYQNVEAHLIAGYTFGGFKLDDNGVYGIASKKFTSSGFQVGAGTTFGFYDCFSLRLDVVYNGYPSHHHITGVAPSTAQGGPTGGVTTDYKVRTSSIDSTISLVYGF